MRPKKEKEMKKNDIFEMTLTSTFIVVILLMSLVPQLGYITIMPGVSLTLIHIPTMIAVFILKPKSGFLVGIMFGVGSLIASFMYAANAFDIAFRNPIISIGSRALFGISAWAIFQGLIKISKVNYGKYIMFGVVALVTTIAVYYGSVQIAKNSVWASHDSYLQEIDDSGGVADPVILAELSDSASELEPKVLAVVIPVALVIIVIFITLYFVLITKDNYTHLALSSSFILGTIAHTILVLTFVIVFSSDFHMTFGNAVNVIYGIAASNGLIEALAAVLIGTPVYLAISKLPAFESYQKRSRRIK